MSRILPELLKNVKRSNGIIGGLLFLTIAANAQKYPQTANVPESQTYDFSNDVATSTAVSGVSPAMNITIASGNTTTAGVASFTDAGGRTSNRFRAYSGSNRNGTGVVDLNLFPNIAADYSVTWKQNLGSAGVDYKVGFLLRGNGAPGTTTTGYTSGLLNGYVFLVYHNVASSRTDFRIYRSTTSTSLTTLANTGASSLFPTTGQSVWYRATVTGSSPVSLKFEYSLDSLTWSNGAVTTDATSSSFTSGSTQGLWGVGATAWNFFLDNITFTPISGTLPVNLAKFIVTTKDSYISLEWTTFSEFNNRGFEVERSDDGNSFETIGFVPGSKNSSDRRSYNFYDNTASNGKYYYRLKQTDLDGSFKYSEVKVGSKQIFGGSLKIFPNPVTNVLNILSGEDQGTLSIFDLTGRTIYEIAIKQHTETSLDVSHLPIGEYVYRINASKGKFIRN